MRVVAVRAGHAGVVHPALPERAVFEHLAVDLAVRVIEAGFEIRGKIGIEEGRAGEGGWSDRLAAGGASGAGIELRRGELLGPVRDPGRLVYLPVPAIGRVVPRDHGLLIFPWPR